MDAYKNLIFRLGRQGCADPLKGRLQRLGAVYSKSRRTMDKITWISHPAIVNNDTVSTAEIETISARTRTAAFSRQ